jgi:IMP dehydrogenase/GMP reductase
MAFDDVLLVPQRSRIRHRADVDLSTSLGGKIQLTIPIIAANTPWCTEAPMAAEIARLGGLGIIHRICTIERQAAQVRAVKSAAACTSGGVNSQGSLLVGAAIGVNPGEQERAKALVDAGTDIIAVDVAHGHTLHTIKAVEQLRARFPLLTIIAGNVATRSGVRDLLTAGANIIKVGIGPGSVCTTRTVTGAGVPQLTAILDCAEEAAANDATVIADGGIRSSGDIVKALAAGAAAVMVGGLLAGTDESAALLVEETGEKFKTTTGFVSLGAELAIKRERNHPVTREDLRAYVAEGIEATFPYSGPLRDVVQQLCGGIRSGFSYSGAMRIGELWDQAEFIQVNAAGSREGEPHAKNGSRQVHPDFRELLTQDAAGHDNQ